MGTDKNINAMNESFRESFGKAQQLQGISLCSFIASVCKGLTLRVVARMISDEFDSFPANPESPLFVAGDPNRLRRVSRPSGWTSP
jgi:hypothetical protein